MADSFDGVLFPAEREFYPHRKRRNRAALQFDLTGHRSCRIEEQGTVSIFTYGLVHVFANPRNLVLLFSQDKSISKGDGSFELA